MNNYHMRTCVVSSIIGYRYRFDGWRQLGNAGGWNGFRREWCPTIVTSTVGVVNESAVNLDERHEDVEPIEMHEVRTSKYLAITENPNQPRHVNFPKRHFGLSKIISCSFQLQWFDKWKWLHYDEAWDLAFCHVCVTAIKTGKVQNRNVDSAFIEFCNWKDASGEKGAFFSHEQSNCHKRAVELMVTLPT